TTISAGTLQRGGGSWNGNVGGDILNNSALVTRANGPLRIFGDISGSGTLTAAAGSTTLAGTNTYTGGTTINANAELIVGNGGTTGTISGDILNNGFLGIYRSDGVTIDSTISGTGALRSYMGTNILTADNTYAGGTIVRIGELR